jgi:hypothetical protein
VSTYGTEWEHTDDDGDELWVDRCCNRTYPLMLLTGGGREGVALYREEVEALAAYLASVADTVPARPALTPTPAVAYESAGAIRNGQIVWRSMAPTPIRVVCKNTLHITPPTQ